MAAPKKANKKKDVKLTSGILSVNTTTNNTLIVLSDKEGNKILGWWTGLLWYKWAKKNTPYAAEVLTKTILKEAQGYGLRDMGVVIKWVGMARDWVFKAINEVVWLISCISQMRHQYNLDDVNEKDQREIKILRSKI